MTNNGQLMVEACPPYEPAFQYEYSNKMIPDMTVSLCQRIEENVKHQTSTMTQTFENNISCNSGSNYYVGNRITEPQVYENYNHSISRQWINNHTQPGVQLCSSYESFHSGLSNGMTDISLNRSENFDKSSSINLQSMPLENCNNKPFSADSQDTFQEYSRNSEINENFHDNSSSIYN